MRAQIYLMERFFWQMMPPMRPDVRVLPLRADSNGSGPVRVYRIPDNGRAGPDADDDLPMIEGLGRVGG